VAAGSALIARFARDEGGATAIEYAVLIVFLGAGVVAAIGVLQTSLYNVINTAATALVAAVS